ncbi:MAG: ABC transporter permease [SAR324 cluster bacterium]|uniref:Transport permease protein n=1 Tax=SAR324 cluster bacterium TaxID=2024889 RepID=A0A7X9FT11_9DELT|nr:ABC transporter permease [SAR324 cluster bacterium]
MKQERHFFIDFFYQIYTYREFLKQSVLRDLRTKYKRSALGYLWTMLHPLGMMAVLAVVFSHIMRIPIKNYAIFLFAGLLAWNYFNSTVMMSLNNIRQNARLFSQIALPKYIFIISLVVSNLVNFLLALIPLLFLMLFFKQPITWAVLSLPIMLLPFLCVVVGISLLLATSNVFFDDTLHLSEVGMQAVYFLCPVLYHRELLPPWLVKYLVLNPLFCEIEFIRGIFYEGVLPDLTMYLINLTGALFVLATGLAIFHRSESKFMYFV